MLKPHAEHTQLFLFDRGDSRSGSHVDTCPLKPNHTIGSFGWENERSERVGTKISLNELGAHLSHLLMG